MIDHLKIKTDKNLKEQSLTQYPLNDLGQSTLAILRAGQSSTLTTRGQLKSQEIVTCLFVLLKIRNLGM